MANSNKTCVKFKFASTYFSLTSRRDLKKSHLLENTAYTITKRSEFSKLLNFMEARKVKPVFCALQCTEACKKRLL